MLTGGSESMSQAPYAARDALGDAAGRSPKMEDMLWESLTDTYRNTPMAVIAENIVERRRDPRRGRRLPRLQPQRWAAAHEAGAFAAELAPVTVKSRKGEKVIAVDEHPGPQTTLEGLASSRRCSRKTRDSRRGSLWDL